MASSPSAVSVTGSPVRRPWATLVIRSPALAPVILPRLAAVINLPDADEFAAEVKALLQPQPQAAPPVNPKDQAQADKYAAEAKGQEIDNTIRVGQLFGHLPGMGPAEQAPPEMGMPGAPDAMQGQPA